MKQNELIKTDKQIIINWLIEHFPNAFFKKSQHIKPLQIGIFDEIVEFYDRLDEPSFSKKGLREALSYYSSSPAYLLICQKENTARIDLGAIMLGENEVVTNHVTINNRSTFDCQHSLGCHTSNCCHVSPPHSSVNVLEISYVVASRYVALALSIRNVVESVMVM